MDDGAGDSETLTITNQPNQDGGYTVDVVETYTVADQPSPAAGDDTTTGGSGSLTYHITAGPSGASMTMDQDASVDFKVDQTITSGAIGGTWTDSGNQTSKLHDTANWNSDGTFTDTYTAAANSSDNYNLQVSGTLADGSSLNCTDTGSDTSSTDGSGNQNNGSDNEDETSTETTTMNVSGDGYSWTSNDQGKAEINDISTYSPGAAADDKKTTDTAQDATDNKESGTMSGAPYTVEDKRTATQDNSDEAITGGPSGNTDNLARTGTSSDQSTLSLSGVDEGNGVSGSLTDTLSTTGTTSDQYITALNSSGTPITQEVLIGSGTNSSDVAGTDEGASYDIAVSGTSSTDIEGHQDPGGFTPTKDVEADPQTVKTTGSPPGQSPLQSATTEVDMEQEKGRNAAGAAAAIVAAAAPAQKAAPTNPIHIPNPENVTPPWYWLIYNEAAKHPLFDIQFGTTEFVNQYSNYFAPNTPFAQFIFKHSLQSAPDNLFFPAGDSFTLAILASPEYAAAVDQAEAMAAAGETPKPILMNFDEGDLHFAIGHAFLVWSVATGADGTKTLSVQVTDRYVFENDILLWFTDLKGAVINQVARTQQGFGAINPFTWWTEAVKSKLD